MSLLQHLDKKSKSGNVSVQELVGRIKKIPKVVNISRFNVPPDSLSVGQYGFVINLSNSSEFVIKFFDKTTTRNPEILTTEANFVNYTMHNPVNLVKIYSFGDVKQKPNTAFFVMEKLKPLNAVDEIVVMMLRKVLSAYTIFNKKLSDHSVSYGMSYREMIESFGSIDNFILNIEDNEHVFVSQYEQFKDDTLENFHIFFNEIILKKKMIGDIYNGLIEYHRIFGIDYDDLHSGNIMYDERSKKYKIIDLN